VRSRHAVLRLVPAVPMPATHAVRPPASGALHSGPATPGRKQARVTGVSFTIDVRSRGWIVAAQPYIADVRRFDNFGVGMSVIVPDQVLGAHGSSHEVTSPQQMLAVLRGVTDLEVGRETRTTVGGVPARSVMLRVRAGAPRAGFCPAACVAIYVRDQVTTYVLPAMRLTLLRVHGRTVAIAEDTAAPASLAKTGAIVRRASASADAARAAIRCRGWC
jgi:hypothetical protein